MGWRRSGSSVNGVTLPEGDVTVQASRSTETLPVPWLASTSATSPSMTSSGSATGNSPFWKQLLEKIGPNDGAITQRMSKPNHDPTAATRERPQPQLSAA